MGIRSHAPSLSWHRRLGTSGHTYIELVVTTVVLLVLASAALPIAATARRREKEIVLRRSLREIRAALDVYYELCKASTGGGGASSPLTIKIENDPGLTCTPKDLEVLIEGVPTNKPGYKLKFLRRIPRDPFNVEDEEFDQFGWRLISTTDKGDVNLSWNRANVMDVASGSERQALDGSFYKEW